MGQQEIVAAHAFNGELNRKHTGQGKYDMLTFTALHQWLSLKYLNYKLLVVIFFSWIFFFYAIYTI